jgi:dihydrofolate reductase
MSKNISIIVAIAEDYGIGYQNKLLAHISTDLKRFAEITRGHTVVMGRNTWNSLPRKPLKERKNIIITDNPEDVFEGATTVFSIDEAIEACPANDESFIIGGAMVYRQFFPKANRLYITKILKSFTADTYFPEITEDEWAVESESEIFTDKKNNLNFQYVNFIRKI